MLLHPTHDGSVPGFASSLVSLAKKSKQQHLLGNSLEEQAFVRQWLEYAVCNVNNVDVPHISRQVLKVKKNCQVSFYDLDLNFT